MKNNTNPKSTTRRNSSTNPNVLIGFWGAIGVSLGNALSMGIAAITHTPLGFAMAIALPACAIAGCIAGAIAARRRRRAA